MGNSHAITCVKHVTIFRFSISSANIVEDDIPDLLNDLTNEK